MVTLAFERRPDRSGGDENTAGDDENADTGISGAGIVGFRLLLILAGYDFQWLTLSLCGVILCIYIGVPSLYSGIAGLELTGRAAALTQATQFLGPVTGPAVGAIIATHSVTLFSLPWCGFSFPLLMS